VGVNVIKRRLMFFVGYKLGELPNTRDLLNVRSTLLLVSVMLSFSDVDVRETNFLGSGFCNLSTFYMNYLAFEASHMLSYLLQITVVSCSSCAQFLKRIILNRFPSNTCLTFLKILAYFLNIISNLVQTFFIVVFFTTSQN